MEKIENGKKCEWCGKDLVGKQERYCSTLCYSKYSSDKKKKPIIEKECNWCGNPFTPKRITQKFCTKECNTKYYHSKTKENRIKIKIKKQCKNCNSPFTTTNNNKKYCSKECSKEYALNKKYQRRKEKRKNKKCEFCGKEIINKNRLCRFCSDKCYKRNYYLKSRTKQIKKVLPKCKCNNCKTLFIPKTIINKFCSKKCSQKHYNKKRKENKIQKKCESCNKILGENKWKFCSKECFYKEYNAKKKKERTIEKKCKWCDKDFITTNNSKKYCSQKCYKEYGYKDPICKLNKSISSGLRESLKSVNLSKNKKHWETLLVNNLQEITEHLEKHFLPGMSWKNIGRGGWHIDHIIPKEFFRFTSTDDAEFKYCWSINNLQPLWEVDNIRKGDKVMLWGKEINARDIDKYTNAII